MNATAEKIPQPAIRNGVDVTALFATIDAVKKDPAIAQFRFRARNRWLGGDANRTTVSGFYGAKQEQPHAAPFEMSPASRPCCSGATAVQTRSNTC